MANDLTIRQVLTDAIESINPAQTGMAITAQMQQLTDQILRLQTVQQAAAEAVVNQTQVIKTPAPTTAGPSQISSNGLGGWPLSAFGTGLGISPLISDILKLFGGSDTDHAISPLVKFSLPTPLNVQAGVRRTTGEGIFGVDTAQGNLSRPVASPGPQITVQVNAMDSKSFLDHSNDIALAVRQAMLESSVLSDVVREA